MDNINDMLKTSHVISFHDFEKPFILNCVATELNFRKHCFVKNSWTQNQKILLNYKSKFLIQQIDRQYRHSRQICSVLGQKCIVQQNAIAKSVDYSLKNEVDPGIKSWIWSIQWSFFFIITTCLRVAYGIINICYKFGRIYCLF